MKKERIKETEYCAECGQDLSIDGEETLYCIECGVPLCLNCANGDLENENFCCNCYAEIEHEEG
jgi:hypothetical protein